MAFQRAEWAFGGTTSEYSSTLFNDKQTMHQFFFILQGKNHSSISNSFKVKGTKDRILISKTLYQSVTNIYHKEDKQLKGWKKDFISNNFKYAHVITFRHTHVCTVLKNASMKFL